MNAQQMATLKEWYLAGQITYSQYLAFHQAGAVK